MEQRLVLGHAAHGRSARILIGAGRSGRHHIYKHPDVVERLNLQPRGDQAKEYQLRQLMELVEAYELELEE